MQPEIHSLCTLPAQDRIGHPVGILQLTLRWGKQLMLPTKQAESHVMFRGSQLSVQCDAFIRQDTPDFYAKNSHSRTIFLSQIIHILKE